MNYILSYPYSAILYTSIILLVTIISYVSMKMSSKSIQIGLLVLNILILTFFAGFRGISVGRDTAQYIQHIWNWQNNIKNTFNTEPGLYILNKISSLFINDPQFTIITAAFITNFLIVLRLWSLKGKISFPFAMFLYLITYYLMTFSGIRQWLAIAIIFYGIKYIFKKEYFKFSLMALIASLFHNTAVLVLLIPVLEVLTNFIKNKMKKKVLVILILISPFLIMLILVLEVKFSLFSQYFLYVNNFNWNKSSGLIIWGKIIIGIIIYSSFIKKDINEYNFYKQIFKLYFFGLLISIPGYYISNLARIGYYFTIFEIILFSLLIKSNNKKKAFFFCLLISTFSLILYVIELAGSGRGHMPYLPFWK